MVRTEQAMLRMVLTECTEPAMRRMVLTVGITKLPHTETVTQLMGVTMQLPTQVWE